MSRARCDEIEQVGGCGLGHGLPSRLRLIGGCRAPALAVGLTQDARRRDSRRFRTSEGSETARDASRDNVFLVKSRGWRLCRPGGERGGEGHGDNRTALRELIIAHGARIVEAGFGGAPAGDISARFPTRSSSRRAARSTRLASARRSRRCRCRRIRRLEGADEALGRMAHRSRRRPRAAGCRGDHSLPVALRDRAGDGAKTHSRRAFDDRPVRRRSSAAPDTRRSAPRTWRS